MFAHVCYAMLSASVVHILVIVAHFDVVVVHFASVSSVDEEFWLHWELRSVVRKDGIDLDLPTVPIFVVHVLVVVHFDVIVVHFASISSVDEEFWLH